MMTFGLLFLLLLAGSLVYSLMTIVAAWQYLGERPPALRETVPVSVLRPLSGLDDGLEENLRSLFTQQYGEFELLFAVHHEDDPAIAVVEKLRREFPAVPAQLLISGDPPYPNAKVFSLDMMLQVARHELVVMTDSDVCVSPRLLETVSRDFGDDRVGLLTCPYRAVAGRSIWNRLEAIFINTEFLGGVLVARMLNGMDFALGPTLAVRKKVLAQIGGFELLKDYLAEDFVLGNRAAAMGVRVVLSSEVIEHRIGSHAFRQNLRHRLRWLRSTRRSRPAGYVGQVFTNPLPLALLMWAAMPGWWPVVVVTIVVRATSAWAQAWWVLRDRLLWRYCWVIPIQDVASFLLWCAGFFGNTVVWRGRSYYVARDGRFELRG